MFSPIDIYRAAFNAEFTQKGLKVTNFTYDFCSDALHIKFIFNKWVFYCKTPKFMTRRECFDYLENLNKDMKIYFGDYIQ